MTPRLTCPVGSRLLIALCTLFVLLSGSATATAAQEPADEAASAVADTAGARSSGWLPLPIIFYTPETKTAFGASALHYFRSEDSGPDSRPSNLTAVLIYTTRKQIIAMLPVDLYWQDERFHFQGMLGYVKYPDYFYGIGNDTAESAEEKYTARTVWAGASLQRLVAPDLYVGPSFELGHSRMLEIAPDGLLADGDITGSEGGRVVGAGPQINWDSRDNIFNPTSGHLYTLSASFFNSALGSDFDFSRRSIDLRKYWSLAATQVLAVQGVAQFMSGSPPFQVLAQLGGPELMRGYYQGRYRDRNLLALQVEYRRSVWRRLGLVLFGGVGDVAARLDDFRTRDFKHSVGWGLRFCINRDENINLRLDFGYGKDTSGTYITMTEAF